MVAANERHAASLLATICKKARPESIALQYYLGINLLGFDALDSQSTVRPSNLPARVSIGPGLIKDSFFQGAFRS
jgi:predicted RNA-binding protein